MALIYANAVNKRINSSQPTRKTSADCSLRGYTSCSHKISKELTPRKKLSTTNNELTESGCTNAPAVHRTVQRSKTSCGELLSKIEEDNARKISSPAMSQSITSDSLSSNKCQCKSKSDVRKLMAKKALIQKYNLETSGTSRSVPRQMESDEEENVVVSEEDKNQCTNRHRFRRLSETEQSFDEQQNRKSRKTSMFDRMRRKLSSFKI